MVERSGQVRLSDTYVSMTQAASILWVNRVTIRLWVRRGKLKGEKIGRVTLIPKQDVLAMALQRGIRL